MAAALLAALTTAQCTNPVGGDGSQAASEGLVVHRVLDFDYTTVVCAPGRRTCKNTLEQCFCGNDFDHNDFTRIHDGIREAHFLVVGGDARRAAIERDGNRMAVNLNTLNSQWQEGAVARADAAMSWARRQFSSGVPAWFLVNEVSVGRWPRHDALGAAYRRYVIAYVRRLAEHYGRHVVVLVPFATPSGHAADWRALARYATIGIENYLSGAKIRGHGYSEAWCRRQYAASIHAFGRMGIPARRLMLVEHFGHTAAGVGWGRSGVSIPQWKHAITVRTRAARSLPFRGYISYAWSFNHMNALSRRRLACQDTYHAAGGGRLDIPDSSASATDDGGTTPVPTSPVPSTSACGSLSGGSSLGVGSSLASCDGRFQLRMQGDGNLVLYQGGSALWASHTEGSSADQALMQSDGNFVVYDAGGHPLWAAGTYGHAGAHVRVQDDGNLVIYADGGETDPLWASNTGGR